MIALLENHMCMGYSGFTLSEFGAVGIIVGLLIAWRAARPRVLKCLPAR